MQPKYSSTEVEGMGYAIPISQAQDIINELMNKKTVSQSMRQTRAIWESRVRILMRLQQVCMACREVSMYTRL